MFCSCIRHDADADRRQVVPDAPAARWGAGRGSAAGVEEECCSDCEENQERWPTAERDVRVGARGGRGGFGAVLAITCTTPDGGRFLARASRAGPSAKLIGSQISFAYSTRGGEGRRQV